MERDSIIPQFVATASLTIVTITSVKTKLIYLLLITSTLAISYQPGDGKVASSNVPSNFSSSVQQAHITTFMTNKLHWCKITHQGVVHK